MMLLKLLLRPEWLCKMGTSCILPADVYPVKIHEAVEIGSFLVALAVAKIILYFQTEGWLLQ